MASRKQEHNESLDNAFHELQKLLGALNTPTGLVDLDTPDASPTPGPGLQIVVETPTAWQEDLARMFSPSPRRRLNHKTSLPRIGDSVLDSTGQGRHCSKGRPKMSRTDSREQLSQLPTPASAVSSTAHLRPAPDSADKSSTAASAEEFLPPLLPSGRSKCKSDRDDELARMAKLLEQRDQELPKVEAQLKLRDKQVEELKASVNDLTKSLAKTQEELARRNKEFQEASSQLAAQLAQTAKPSRVCEDVLSATKADLHKTSFALQRLEANFTKHEEDFTNFLKAIASSSSTPVLDQLYNVRDANVIGMGNYGFVIACVNKKSKERVVIKLQGEKKARIAASEWAHGSGIGKHAHIVNHVQALLHHDSNRSITRLLEEAFVSGSLSGKRPVFFPQQYFCCVLEYMDNGTAQQLLDSGTLTVEGVAAITWQIADALAYVHQSKRTHNDVKPDNILLHMSSNGDQLVAKLADFGLAEHSTLRARDLELFGYTIWCLGTGAKFKNCPSKAERPMACEAFKTILHGKGSESKTVDALAQVVDGTWQERITMHEVASMDILTTCRIRLQQSKSALESCHGNF